MNSGGAQGKGYVRLTHQVTDPRTTVMLIGGKLCALLSTILNAA